MKSCKECGKEGCLLNQTEGYCLDCPECGVNWKEKKMEFDKNRVFSAANADELHAGDKVCVADTLMGLENRVRHECVAELEEVLPDYNEHRFKAYLGIHNLAYLVERAENCTNCQDHEYCGFVQNQSRFANLNRCDKYTPKTEQKAEKHYRPFRDTDELVKVWCEKGGKWQKRELTMPHIWVREKEYGITFLITGFADNRAFIDDDGYGMDELLEQYTFLDGSVCGVEE